MAFKKPIKYEMTRDTEFLAACWERIKAQHDAEVAGTASIPDRAKMVEEAWCVKLETMTSFSPAQLAWVKCVEEPMVDGSTTMPLFPRSKWLEVLLLETIPLITMPCCPDNLTAQTRAKMVIEGIKNGARMCYFLSDFQFLVRGISARILRLMEPSLLVSSIAEFVPWTEDKVKATARVLTLHQLCKTSRPELTKLSSELRNPIVQLAMGQKGVGFAETSLLKLVRTLEEGEPVEQPPMSSEPEVDANERPTQQTQRRGRTIASAEPAQTAEQLQIARLEAQLAALAKTVESLSEKKEILTEEVLDDNPILSTRALTQRVNECKLVSDMNRVRVFWGNLLQGWFWEHERFTRGIFETIWNSVDFDRTLLQYFSERRSDAKPYGLQNEVNGRSNNRPVAAVNVKKRPHNETKYSTKRKKNDNGNYVRGENRNTKRGYSAHDKPHSKSD